VHRSIGLGVLLVAVLLLGWSQGWLRSSWRKQERAGEETIIDKQPVAFAQHTFDPAAPPPDMPPLGEGEEAECDSDFLSNASVSGRVKKLGPSDAVITVTGVKITLQLKINVWIPAGAAERIVEHEQGHRKISEAYYLNADRVAARIGAAYIGKQVSVSGDPDSECSKALQQLGAAITAEYNGQLNPGPAQQRFDDLTDYSRNDQDAKEAVLEALQQFAR
jgi:hypothetical protein